MNLLLLLTALLASLTGSGPADRGVRGVQDVAVVRAAEMVQAVGQRVSAARPTHPLADGLVTIGQVWAVSEATMFPGAEQRFERRLE